VVGKGGPKVILRGKVISRRLQGDDTLPKGCSVALGHDEKEKTNYLNGYVRGGLLNLRETRRIPVRLKVTYGGLNGPVDSHTRDINDEGVFVVAEEPLPEESEIHIYVSMPDRSEPYSLAGTVVHTVVVEDEDIPGMGIRFSFESKAAVREFTDAVDSLEKKFLSGQLSDDFLV
jgi:Tfp pilus assembly protein PilZ